MPIMEDAKADDCLHPKEGKVSGLLNGPVVVARALSGNCPK